MGMKLIAVMLAMFVGAGHAAAQSAENERAPGWYYLWAQCSQEPSTSDERSLCEEGIEGEYPQALAISSVFEVESDFGPELKLFTDEVGRRFGFDAAVTDVGPFPTFQEAEAAIVTALKASRRIEAGLLAVTPVALEPDRLDDEPNEAERLAEPGPLPPVMASFRGDAAQVWRDDAARVCGLRLADGREVIPSLVTDLWGEDGELCPAELAEGSGIYRFDVPRSGTICGETGICTELYDSDGHWIGVIEESPYPVFSIDLFRDWGIISTGMWNNRLYSIPERRFLFERWPGPEPDEESRVIVAGAVIVDDRLAIEIEREYRERGPDIGYFWLDTLTFEPADYSRE